ncbi:PEP-CTERM sorting domain-containing protein [Luteolibacter soli]|uniref:PEP-CTERM sorting domain-containing protein n=1 Tax=Luteolibacter soli TaxID=3135280 RepID=A0ABU9AND8_9BACT
MKTPLRPTFTALALLLAPCGAATIVQTFESGEDTSNWGSSWNGGAVTTTFLSPGLGGESAGSGTSASQSFSRTFRNNTAGLDVTSPYTISAYVQVNAFDGPSGGDFEIIDGSFGSANAANLGIRTETVSPGVFIFHWQAKNGGVWNDLGITMDLGAIYEFELGVDTLGFDYSATVRRVTAGGIVLESAGLSNLAFDSNVISNGQNGELRFYIQAAAGGTDALVDNINIQSVPEPSAPVLVLGGSLMLFRRRRSSAT